MSTFGYYEKQSSLTIDELTGTIDEQNWRYDDRTILSAMPTTLLADKDGNIYEYGYEVDNDDNGTLIDGWMVTKDINMTNLMARFRVLRLDVYYTGDGLVIDYSIDKGTTWTNVGTLSANINLEAVQRAYLRLDCNMVRFRFRNNTASQHFNFSRANLYWQPAGRRL